MQRGHPFIWPAANVDESKEPQKHRNDEDDRAYAVDKYCRAHTLKTRADLLRIW